MFLKNIEQEITGSLTPLKDLRVEADIKFNILNWVRNRKLPIEENEELISKRIELSDSKPRGVKPAFISDYFINRLRDNQLDVLGSLVSGKLTEYISGIKYKECLLLPKPYPHLPHNKDGIFIWVPPASDLFPPEKDDLKTSVIIDTFLDYTNQLNEFYLLLPKNILSSKEAKKLRNLFLSKTEYAVILKYSSFFNGVLLKISKSIKTNLNEINCPCYFHSNIKQDKTQDPKLAYQKYFKNLANFIDKDISEFEWILTTDTQKAVIQLKNTPHNKIGDLIDIQPYETRNTITLKETDRIYKVNDNYFDYKQASEENAPYESYKDLKFNYKLLDKDDHILKARAPLKVIKPPPSAHAVYLQNNYYILKLNESMLNASVTDRDEIFKKITTAIDKFNIRYGEELKCLGTINFKLLRNIPLSEE